MLRTLRNGALALLGVCDPLGQLGTAPRQQRNEFGPIIKA